MNESVLDLALRHTVGLRFRLGLFVSPSRDCLLAQQVFERRSCCAAPRNAIRLLAEQEKEVPP